MREVYLDKVLEITGYRPRVRAPTKSGAAAAAPAPTRPVSVPGAVAPPANGDDGAALDEDSDVEDSEAAVPAAPSDGESADVAKTALHNEGGRAPPFSPREAALPSIASPCVSARGSR